MRVIILLSRRAAELINNAYLTPIPRHAPMARGPIGALSFLPRILQPRVFSRELLIFFLFFFLFFFPILADLVIRNEVFRPYRAVAVALRLFFFFCFFFFVRFSLRFFIRVCTHSASKVCVYVCVCPTHLIYLCNDIIAS